MKRIICCILIFFVILNTTYTVHAAEADDVLQWGDAGHIEENTADDILAAGQIQSGDTEAEAPAEVSGSEESGEESDSSYLETVRETNEESIIDPDTESPEPEILLEDEIEASVPEDTESMAEELVGDDEVLYLSITWQDGYIQKIRLDNCESEEQLLSQTRSILNKMGLPDDTYRITADGKSISAEIISRDYYEGDEEVRVLAHMGYYMTATRNTLSAFRVARALGYHYVGGDVRFTKDNVPVVVHDLTINATARKADGSSIGMPVTVRKYTYKELLKYDFGLSTDPVWKGEKIPTLEEYLTLCNKIGLIPNIHIKTDSGLTTANFRSVAEIVMRTGMQGVATYAANYVSYLRPIIKIDSVSIVDIVITDKWDPHYVTDALSLRTGENQIELGIIRQLYAKSIARTCRYNNILLTTSANSKEQAARLDTHVSMIATDGALPDVIIEGARERSTYGGDYVETDPEEKTDYQLLAHANTGVMVRMISSRPNTKLKLDTNPSNIELSMFRFERNSEGYYNIICSRNMLAVGVKGGSTENGAVVILADRNRRFKSQMWELVHNDDGSVSFINRHSGKALQEIGDLQKKSTLFEQGTYDGRSSQRFWLKESAEQIDMEYVDSIVRFQPPKSSIAISTANNSAAVGAAVMTVKYAEDDIQKYTLLYSGDGYYRLVNVKSGLVLTLKEKDPAGSIISSTWGNKSSQRWKLVMNNDEKYPGTYRFVSKYNSSVITIKGSVNSARAIIAEKWSGKRQQQWRITDC